MARKSYKQKYNSKDGVWRTIGGRRVFIRHGQKLSEAMKESGKFKTGTRHEVQQAIAEKKIEKLGKENEEIWKKTNKFDDSWYDENGKLTKEGEKLYNKREKNAEEMKMLQQFNRDYQPRVWEDDRYNNPKEFTGDISDLEGKHIAKAPRNLAKESADQYMKDHYEERKQQFESWQKESQKIGGKDDTFERATNKVDTTKLKGEYYNLPKRTPQEQASDERYANAKAMYKLTGDEKYKKAYQEEIEKTTERIRQKVENEKQSNKTIHTQSGSYSPKELKDRDESIKQMYKDTWNGKKSYRDLHNELEDLKKQGKISQGELESLQYDASEETRRNETGFVQHTDMYGGTYEYTNARLKQMEEAGTKPMAHSYTGGGWEGTKYNSSLSTKEIAKNISDYSKENFPDVKLSRKTDYNGIDIHIMSSGKNLYLTEKDIDKMSDDKVFETIHSSIGGVSQLDTWLEQNNRKSSNGTYTTNDARDYLKMKLSAYKDRDGDSVNGNEWYLSDYGKKVVSGLNKEMNSYNYDDSDGMVDYFDTNFYGYVHIGRWDRPYEVSNNESDFKKLYQQYLKEHKGSNMSLEDFKKWYK